MPPWRCREHSGVVDSLGQATLVSLGYVTSFRLVELSVNNLSLEIPVVSFATDGHVARHSIVTA